MNSLSWKSINKEKPVSLTSGFYDVSGTRMVTIDKYEKLKKELAIYKKYALLSRMSEEDRATLKNIYSIKENK